jgi:hypothetical protein
MGTEITKDLGGPGCAYRVTHRRPGPDRPQVLRWARPHAARLVRPMVKPVAQLRVIRFMRHMITSRTIGLVPWSAR